jgi:predicted transcriptional regulator
MATSHRKTPKLVRRSVSLPGDIDRQVQQLARSQSRSTASMLEALVEAGLAAREAEKRRFFELAERLRVSTDPDEVQLIKQDLARMTFGA